jgi:DNA-binding XRE family transcriptional regulator
MDKRRLSDEEIESMLREKPTTTYEDLAKKFSVRKSTVYEICVGNTVRSREIKEKLKCQKK